MSDMIVINSGTKALPVEEDFDAKYSKGNPMGTIPVTYTTSARLRDGEAKLVSLARRRYRDTTPSFEPTLMNVEIDELDGLIELLTVTRDAMKARGMKTRYER